MKKLRHICFGAIIMALLIGCAKTKEQEIQVESVSLSQPTAELIVGETVQLIATVLPSNATEKTVIWASSKKSVATVSDNGLVSAVAEGTSTITASAGGKSSSCVVTVSKRVIEVTSVTLSKENLKLVEGEEEILVATVKPDDATDKTVDWTSSSPDVAKVSGGKVSALKEGEAVITATAGTKSASCKVVVTKKFVAVESIKLDKTSLELVEGDSDILIATVKPDDATDKTVTWMSSDDSVVTVDNSGRIKAIKEGKASIVAKAGDQTAKCEVTVSKKVIPVESITLDRTSISMVKGESTVLTATVNPNNATDKTVVWSSSNAQVASVDNTGKVKALKSGTATITAKAGDRKATCTVTVTNPVTSITLDKTSISLEEGQSTTLTATVSPNDADDKTVTWSSSSTSVATVDNNGKVTAVKAGSATITAKAGGKSATCEVSVKKQVIQVTSITLNKSSLTLEKGKSETLTATIKPDNATDKTVNWSSSDSSIAAVDSNGKVTAVKSGQAVITAKAGEKTATCAVTVIVPVSSITLSEYSLTITKGQSITLTATVNPEDATDKTVTWVSSDKTVATVDQNGKVVAKAGGKTTITAACGGKTAECSMTVTVPVESVSLDKTSITLDEGQSTTLTATIYPSDATDKTLTWSSSNTSVATVSNGKVVAVKEGTATIKVTAGSKSASCSVTVKKGPQLEAVDMGLSVKWASFNLGASKPEEYGDYYAWGEITPKDDYSWANYEWCDGSDSTLTRYNNDSSFGAVDNKSEFMDYNYEDDAARQALGGKWRLPTDAEWTELRTKCTWTWTTRNGVKGRLVTAPNGNSIFLPAAGFRLVTELFCAGSRGEYWSSSLYTESPNCAMYIYFTSDSFPRYRCQRSIGLSVRPVTK